MDMNQSMEFTPISVPSPQVHNFMPMSPLMLSYQQAEDNEEARHTHFMQIQKQNLNLFWHQQISDIDATTAFKNNNSLPLARVKKIMKQDGKVKMISADTPVLFSKACELFIMEITLRSWLQTELIAKRRTLHRSDISRAIKLGNDFHFLLKSVPSDDDQKDVEAGNLYDHMIETHPVNELNFPLLDMNAEFGMSSPEASQSYFMTKPPMSTHWFHFGSSSK
ncbi:CBFD_NFYB_HMF domain-containing protein [Cephalotus follicularis]|uniref:CBFD_NFYB_HMF domain-containing protein n=1 Tax=Cephalotus follicularis TaxID=3775 RepID=A0A1Q3DCH3_CEPFO|nr:CBFD_NFYB_HMF domain-containing protein [Cephalotus follicularis]